MEIELPDGTILEAPDNADPSIVAKSYLAQKPKTAHPLLSDPRPSERFSGVARGLMDPIEGGAQLLVRGLNKIGVVPDSEVQKVESRHKENERVYREDWRRGIDPGLDVGRMAGSMVPTGGLLRAIPAAKTLGGMVGSGGAAGTIQGLLSPVRQTEDFWSQKGEQGLLGLGVGAGTAPVAAGFSRLVRPNTRPEVRALMDEGVTPTPGQIMGGFSQRAEEGATSIPLLGDAIKRSQLRATTELNTAAFNRALSPIGERLPKGLQGREAVEYVGDKLGQRYDALLPKLKIQADPQFASEIQSLRSMVQNGAISKTEADQFEKILQNQVLNKFQGQNSLSGETMKEIEHDLGYLASKFQRDPSSDKQLLGDALQEVQANLRRMVERTNPTHRGELSKINAGWANFKRTQRAASSVAAEDGVFSAAQLHNAVKALDRSKDKGQFAKGNALMQDLSDTAKTVMGSKVPDSGTPFRVANIATGASAAFDPTYALSLGGAGLLYTKPAQKIMAGLLTKRPEFAGPLSDAIRSSTPYLGAGAYGLLQ